MLELHIPIVKSVVSMNNTTCDANPQPTGLRIAYKDGCSDREDRFSEHGNGNPIYSSEDVMWPEGCEMDLTPPLRQPLGRNRGRGESMDEYMGLQNREEMNYRVQEYRDDQQYKDDWEVDRPAMRQRPQGRGDRYTEDAEDVHHDRHGRHHDRMSDDRGSRGSKALQKYGTMKKFTICELLKARQKDKKTKKAFQALMELKQSMGTKMSGSFFQRRGHGQAHGHGHDVAVHGGEQDAFPHSGNASKVKGEYETFVLSLIPELKKLDDQQMRQFKWKVLQLIDDLSAGSDSNTSFDKTGGANGQLPAAKQINCFESDQSGNGVHDVYQEHFDQDLLAEPVLTDQCGDKDGQWWDRETSHQTYQQQGNPYQQQQQPHQQSKQPYRSQQPYQTHQQPWQQHQQPYEPHCEPQLLHQRYRAIPTSHRPHCESQPPCQPRCAPHQPRHSHCEPPPSHQPRCQPQPPCQPCCEPQPPCQPCCEPPQPRHSNNGDSEHRPSKASEDSHHQEAQSNRSSYQSHTSNNSARSGSPSRRAH